MPEERKLPEKCEAKERLANAYSAATSDYNRSVEVLAERIGFLAKEEYEHLRELSEAARHRAEAARHELEAHRAEHNC